MNDFLPTGTEIPASGNDNYMRWEAGENKFRVLSTAITGYELWIEGKPVRRKEANFEVSELDKADINKFTGDKKLPRYFWAFVVWNYAKEKVQVLEVTQVTIMRGIESYVHDEDYGNPKGYDLVVTQFEGDNDKIQYTVKAKPPKEVDSNITDAYQKVSVSLQALYRGDDPFAKEVRVNSEEVDEADIPL